MVKLKKKWSPDLLRHFTGCSGDNRKYSPSLPDALDPQLQFALLMGLVGRLCSESIDSPVTPIFWKSKKNAVFAILISNEK